MANLKNNLIFGLIGVLIGAFLVYKFGNKPQPSHNEPKSGIEAQAKSELESKNNTKCVVKKVTDSNGNVTETIEAESNSLDNSKNEAKAAIKPQSDSNSIDIFAGFGVNEHLKPLGSLGIIYKRHSLDFITNTKDNHILMYKYKLFSF